jgi:serine/threonine protein kinase/tetratricopeptide (TPR) repeat protein
MNTVRLDEEAIFQVARRIQAAEARGAYLEQVCGQDRGLRDRLDALLRVYEQEQSFLEEPPAGPGASPIVDVPPLAEGPGMVIGPYKLLEMIGEGGMGVVYMAEQTRPVRRKVALKIIKPGMDTRQVIARFEAERQALALMDHPNIARVLDAGTTESGRPYFVMELVKGIPITEYCDRNRLAIEDRLALFAQVCQAVQHAHQKGIIHRDLKPSNVLVTLIDGAAVPKVIDFGVAKAMGQQLTEKTLFTGFAQLIGTPLYMSPEQAEFSGADVDTRSDIYALGVLLYELLTGTTPFDAETFRTAAYDEIRRIIREQEPPKPSTRISTLEATATTVSANRRSDPRSLGKMMRGELDWIVMKALEKDRNRRYETPNGLVGDLRRYLNHEPVEAGPPSAWYRLRKYARRNRVMLATAAAVATTLVAGAAISTWQAVRATRAEAKAGERAEEARLVLDYLVQDVFGAARPEKTRGRTLTVNELLTQGEKAIGARFAGRPLVEASARQALGESFAPLGRVEEAQRQFRRVAEVRAALLGPEHPDTLTAEGLLADALREEFFLRYRPRPEVEPLARHVLEARRRVLGPEHPATLRGMTSLAQALRVVGKNNEALDLARQAFALQARVFGPEDPETLDTLAVSGGTLSELGRWAECEAVLRQVLDIRLRTLGPDHEATLVSKTQVANALSAQGRLDEAISAYREGLEGLKRLWGPTHPYVANYFDHLAGNLRRKNDLISLRDLSEGWLRECLAAPIDPDPADRARLSIRISGFALCLGTLPRAIPFDTDLAVRAAEQAASLNGGWYGRTILGAVYGRLGRFEQALNALTTAAQQHDWRGGNDLHWYVLAAVQAHRGDRAAAEAAYRSAQAPEMRRDSWREYVQYFRDEAEAKLGMVGGASQKGPN